jgi:quercetin dioxygenase-like cupin family protein
MKRTVLSFIILFLFCIHGFAQYKKELIIEPLLKTDSTVIGQKIKYPVFENDQVTVSKITFPPGASTGWHKHMIPVFAYVLKGALTVQMENGICNTFQENTAFSEVFDTWHNGINLSKDETILIAIYLGGKGEAISIRKP